MEQRQIPNFPGYAITNTGCVWSDKSKKFLKPAKRNIRGYLYVLLRRNGKSITKQIHHLVLETYISQRTEGMECRHLDGNPANNCVKNLKWGTSKENAEDAIKHGTMVRGERHGRSKLTPFLIRLIRDFYTTGLVSRRELARLFDVSHSLINSIANRKTWKHVL